jgi:hypothetical protein
MGQLELREPRGCKVLLDCRDQLAQLVLLVWMVQQGLLEYKELMARLAQLAFKELMARLAQLDCRAFKVFKVSKVQLEALGLKVQQDCLLLLVELAGHILEMDLKLILA